MMKQGLRAITMDRYERPDVETDVQKIIESLSIVEQLYPDQTLMLCNQAHRQFHYVGSNCVNILGFSKQELEMFSVQDFFNRIHPEDLRPVQQCFEFVETNKPNDPASHRFILFYRFKKKLGDYVHIRDERLALESSNGKHIYFTIFRDITTEDKFYHVKLDVYKYCKGSVLKIYSYNPRQAEQAITPRQNEIIKLIIHGFSTQEIADRLHVSVNTIKNHKQILFRKINVKSSVELVNFASRQLKFG